MEEDISQTLRGLLDEKRVLPDEPMSLHTTFCIGGKADVLVKPASVTEIEAVIRCCGEYALPYYVIGNGSNLLVGDKGIRGVVIELGNEFAQIEAAEDDTLWVQAGCLLSKVANTAWKKGLTGLEFASGIPGTIGGAVKMNAGAYGGEMKDIIDSVTVLTPEGEIMILPQDRMEFGYRKSIVSEKNYIILEVRLQLRKGDVKKIASRMRELNEARREKQPLEYPSAGSTFKRPEGHFAGKLIMEAGLAGFRIGDAQVSEKHCGFVINRGQATASEIQAVMQEVIHRVQEQFQVTLEPEVCKIGEFF